MTIIIMKQDATTKLPRPMNRAESAEEAVELVAYWLAAQETGNSWTARRTADRYAARVDAARIDTDLPVAIHGKGAGAVSIYAFRSDF